MANPTFQPGTWNSTFIYNCSVSVANYIFQAVVWYVWHSGLLPWLDRFNHLLLLLIFVLPFFFSLLLNCSEQLSLCSNYVLMCNAFFRFCSNVLQLNKFLSLCELQFTSVFTEGSPEISLHCQGVCHILWIQKEDFASWWHYDSFTSWLADKETLVLMEHYFFLQVHFRDKKTVTYRDCIWEVAFGQWS